MTITADTLATEVAEALGWETADGVVQSVVEEIAKRYVVTPRARQHLRADGIPTRNDLSLMVPAERAITDAMRAVEEAGASTALTDAVVLLGKARDLVADHVEAEAP